MNHFEYKDGALHCEDVALESIAQAFGTPVYVYSTATLERHFDVFKQAFAPRDPLIAYAVKANSNLAVLRVLAKRGAGADTVSAGEIKRALRAGVPPSRIIFSGVGKSEEELAFAIQSLVQVNIESVAELDLLSALAKRVGARPHVAIRVNPDVGAGGHDKISTGKTDAKFGVSVEDALKLYARAHADPHLDAQGLAVHIGSQIKDLAPLEAAFRVIRSMVEMLRAQGMRVSRLDLGGGLGVPYFNEAEPPPPSVYAAMIERVFEGLEIDLAFEPGRLIAGNAGVLLTRVIRYQERADRPIIVLDAAMNDLVRPAMYDAYHDLRPVKEPTRDTHMIRADLVGPICETGDTFAKDRALPRLAPGDLAAFMTAGAYGAVMSSTYNSRALIPEVLVSGNKCALVRRRWEIEEQIALEAVPDWLA